MVRVSELNKKDGVCYAATREGVELSVVDVTHPAFALDITDSKQQVLVQQFMNEGIPFATCPTLLRNLLLRVLLRRSVLAKGVREAEGRFMSGLDTYLLKLGPAMLGSAYAEPIDRKLAAALPAMSVRLRLQDVAHLMAETLLPVLEAEPLRALHCLNIAGGPAIDTLNALILLRRWSPGILDHRSVAIKVLDVDDAGPAFGRAALEALATEGKPLQSPAIEFSYVHYDWSHPETLENVLREGHGQGAIVICSSEGGLFEYGSDKEIEANLGVLRRFREVLAVVGSVTRADEPIMRVRQIGPAATRPRGLSAFRELAAKSGWNLARAVERPFSDQVVLT
jgi:hypothetical protein